MQAALNKVVMVDTGGIRALWHRDNALSPFTVQQQCVRPSYCRWQVQYDAQIQQTHA